MPLSVTEKDGGVVFAVFVQPKASRNQVAGLHGDALKIRLTAPPVEGAANKACTQFLAKTLGVPKSAVEIVSGHASRNKKILITPPEGISCSALKGSLETLS